MYDYTLYLCARNHYISFCTFDTAALLCSALYHDPHRTLAQRSEAIEAIGQATAYLDKGRETVPGAKSFHKILTSLTGNLPLDPHERAGLSPSPCLTTGAREQQLPPDSTITSNPLDTAVSGSALDGDPGCLPDDLGPDMMPFPVQDFRVFPDVDFGAISPIWDWENLNLDFVS